MTADGKIYIRSYLITPIENGFSEDDKLNGYYIRFVFLDKGKENFRDVKVFLSKILFFLQSNFQVHLFLF